MTSQSPRLTLILAAAAGSAALMIAALGFQYIGGLAPCQMCIWQRYPHGVAIGLGALALVAPGAGRPIAALGLLAALGTAAVGGFHAGVEQGWWEGVTACAVGSDVTALSTDDLLNKIMEAPIMRCDEIPWSLFGLSMAAWNMVLSLGLAVLWWRAVRV